jgi:hypothetical protein
VSSNNLFLPAIVSANLTWRLDASHPRILNMKTNFTHGEMAEAVANKMRGMSSDQPMNAVAHSGHTQHSGHSAAMFRDKFWLSLTLTLPVVFWSADVQHWLGYRAKILSNSSLR